MTTVLRTNRWWFWGLVALLIVAGSAVAALGASVNAATPPTIYWTDWDTGDFSSGFVGHGTIITPTSTVDVTYTNPQGIAFFQPSGGIDYYQKNGGGRITATSPYTSFGVANIPTGTDIVALRFAGSQTLTFSVEIANLVFSYVSLNGNGYGFDQDFEILSFGHPSDGNDCGYWGCGTSFKSIVPLAGGGFEYQLLGSGEPHGTIRFLGSFSTLTWRSLSNEYWNGFTVGVQGTAAEVSDADGDGVDDADDNCSNTANPNQIDTDNDGIGAACDDEPPLITTFGPATYTEGDAPVIVDSSLTLTASDDINGAKVSIRAGFVAAEDTLGTDGSLPGGLTSSYNSSTGVLTISGTAAASVYQTALRQVTYSNSSGAPDLTAREITFSVGSGLAFPDNGHFYEFVAGTNPNWNDAKATADNKSLFGLQRYLATITSAAENAFVFNKLQGNGWLGATDTADEGTWEWVTGPEAGTVFCIGTGTCVSSGGAYTNWDGGEPNQSGNEDYAHMIGNTALNESFWNDLPVNDGSGNYVVQGYVVEYGDSAGDPSLQLSGTVTVNVAVCQDGAAGGDLVSYWRGEGNACDSADGNHGARVGGTTFAAGKVGQAFSLNGFNDYVEVPESANLHSNEQTVKGWFKVNNLTSPSGWQTIYWKGNTPDCTPGCSNRENSLF